MVHGAPRNAFLALATRERTGRSASQLHVPRKVLSLRQVFRYEEGGVLLGFSSDGNFLVNCITLDSQYEVQWRRVHFQDFHHWREDGHVPETAFKLRVDGASSAYGVNTPLEVWQSADDALVLTVTVDTLAEDRESSRRCRVAVAPSPTFDDGGLAAAVTSLSFEWSQPALSQRMESWQLMHLMRERADVHHLLVNAGTTVHVLVLHVWKRGRGQSQPLVTAAAPKGLGVSYFPEKAWYYPPVFPIKFLNSTEHRHHHATSDRLFRTGVECICQHLFDVERFLGEFLETFKPLRRCNLVDYDLRLVRACAVEKSVFMIYVMALAPSPPEPSRPGIHHLRVALFLSLELFTGAYHIIRVLKGCRSGSFADCHTAAPTRVELQLAFTQDAEWMWLR
ncbi:hypothetical protein PF008_g17716 [Phytophthora fragariae]|uniref:DDB1- and CUL4-associated factor 15 WD40 repeat-containing domain-containing protein n=1 Tax=Phytophthora fragariae TaxID=53985 RepID=A0A6G0R8T5_9STRA|nr:hypothetical protein PF008_g17716 [Phytophthora fragariae]